ncbi:AAA family ATPase [Micromonospora sonchi]|uniref:AAA family ATPase n=1 Tax=Micromonospora sonchi TaxID=1763543 RepID=UPI00166BB310|nr:ATP-binding protein [Micromonospora sonchi]
MLLRLIEAALGHNSRTPPFVGGGSHFEPDVKPLTGVVELVLSVKGEPVSAVVDLSVAEHERAAIWAELLGPSHWPTFVSSAELANDFIWYYQQFSFGMDRPVYARDFTPAERTAVRAILGKTYDSIRMQTILLDGSDDEQWFSQGPYVTAVSGGAVADNTTFSLGELWVYRVLWELERLQPGCLFMMDEPESFLALRGHRPFVDEVARRALGGNLQLLIATHSPQVLSRFPAANVRVCVRGPGGKVVVMKAESSEQVRSIVGMEVPVETLILVEDDFAASFLSEVFACLGLPVAGIEIVPAGGEGNVKSGVRSLLRASRIRVFGVLDADQKGSADESKKLYGTYSAWGSRLGQPRPGGE